MTNAPPKQMVSNVARVKRGCRWRKRLLSGIVGIWDHPPLVYFCAMRSHALLDELRWRGLLYQHTDEVGGALSEGQMSGYIGFDPTAPSLHIGTLLVIMLLVRLQRFGHRPVALVGGGTGLIGDPSGKATERPLADAEVVYANAEQIRK